MCIGLLLSEQNLTGCRVLRGIFMKCGTGRLQPGWAEFLTWKTRMSSTPTILLVSPLPSGTRSSVEEFAWFIRCTITTCFARVLRFTAAASHAKTVVLAVASSPQTERQHRGVQMRLFRSANSLLTDTGAPASLTTLRPGSVTTSNRPTMRCHNRRSYPHNQMYYVL